MTGITGVCEVVAVGTELLLGQVVDTNSAWIGEQLALIGIDCHYQTKVGDDVGRISEALEQALDRSDVVIVCGGLGPTQDDVTREALAVVMGVEMYSDQVVADHIRSRFAASGSTMFSNVLRQADVPVGARVMGVHPGTAPGLICAVHRHSADKVIYAVPGVPWEMKRMVSECVLADLRSRVGMPSVIASRVLRTWGCSESGLAELLDEEIRRLDSTGEATIAFLASGWEGMKLRITAKAPDADSARAVLSRVEARMRSVIGDVVFGVDDETMESIVLRLLRSGGLTLGLAESVTGGLISGRLSGVAGASDVLRGAVVPYHRDLKTSLLRVSGSDGGEPGSGASAAGAVRAVSEEMALAMAAGACAALGCDVGLATTGAAGPDPHEGVDPGTVWIGLHLDGVGHAQRLHLPLDRARIREHTTITALDLLRKRLEFKSVAASAGMRH